MRPRLRGLDSTRLLVLVDGVRLNTARQATERTGAEVGLVSLDDISRLEIVNGAGTLLYGSDALAGTINITTNEPVFSSSRRFTYGFNGFYSSNDDGRRGTLSFGVTAPRYAVQVRGGAERFSTYRAGSFETEDVNPLFASGTLHNVDTIDDNFGSSFKSFPDPFNAPFVRTDAEVPNSQAKGHFLSVSSLLSTGGQPFTPIAGGKMENRPGNSHGGAFGTGTLHLGRALKAALDEGKREALAPAATFEDGLMQQRVLDAARASAAGGEWVRV